MPRPRLCLAMVAGLLMTAGAVQAQSTDDVIAQCRSDDPETAIKACSKLIDSGQSLDIGYGNRGNAFLSRSQSLKIESDSDRALADYNAYIRLKPDSAKGFMMRAGAYDAQKKYDLALADLTQALRFEPDLNYAAFINRGDTYNRKGDYDRAIDDFNQSIRLLASDPKKAAIAYNGRGYAYFKKKNYDQAIADMAQVAKDLPQMAATPYFRLELSFFYFDKGDFANAIAGESEAIRLSPHNALGFSLRCWSRASLNQFYPATEDCTEALRLDPKSSNAFGGRGLIDLKTGKLDEAVADFTESMKLADGDYGDSLYGRGLARIRKGDRSGGEADLAAASKMQDDVALRFTHYGVSAN